MQVADFDEETTIQPAKIEEKKANILDIDNIFGTGPVQQGNVTENIFSTANTGFDDIFGSSNEQVFKNNNDIFGSVQTDDLFGSTVNKNETNAFESPAIDDSLFGSQPVKEESSDVLVKAFANSDITIYYRANRLETPMKATILVSSETDKPISELKLTLLVNKKKVNLNIVKTVGAELAPKASFGVKKEIELTNLTPEVPIAMQIKYSYNCGFNKVEDKVTINNF